MLNLNTSYRTLTSVSGYYDMLLSDNTLSMFMKKYALKQIVNMQYNIQSNYQCQQCKQCQTVDLISCFVVLPTCPEVHSPFSNHIPFQLHCQVFVVTIDQQGRYWSVLNKEGRYFLVIHTANNSSVKRNLSQGLTRGLGMYFLDFVLAL